MKRLDLLKLRKTVGMSQRELADLLCVQPSFLSAIENGRSRFPEEKLERLKEVAGIENLERFMAEDCADLRPVPPHTHSVDESDTLTQLLKHIHAQAHKGEDAARSRERELEERLDYLSARNDRLSDRIDELRSQVDALREENFRLREQLIQTRANSSE